MFEKIWHGKTAWAASLLVSCIVAQAHAASGLQNYTLTQGGAGQQKVRSCKHSAPCESHVAVSEKQGGQTTGSMAADSWSSLQDLSWSSDLSIFGSENSGVVGATSVAESITKHLKIKLPNKAANDETPISFVLTLTGTAPTADAVDAIAELSVTDNGAPDNWGDFSHSRSNADLNGVDKVSGDFVNVSIENSGPGTVTFSGDLHVKGPRGDFAVYVRDDQSAQFYANGPNRRTSGSTNMTISITGPAGLQIVSDDR